MIQTTLFPDTFKHSDRQTHLFDNEDVAYIFEQVADLLEAQANAQENSFYRIRAYRRGGQLIRRLNRPVMDIYQEEGTAGLEKLPNIGRKLALSIEELATTGELNLLERLLAEISPDELFTTIPGIGQTLARKIYQALGISTLEELEQAAHDGSLAKLEGFGKGRVQLVRDTLGARLDRASHQQTRRISQRDRQWQQKPLSVPIQQADANVSKAQIANPSPSNNSSKQLPSVELLLEVDKQYRDLAKIGQLRMVTPRRFNPEGKRWLPVMRTRKAGWSFNVLYSNTARAHELNKTQDWVVVSYEPDDAAAGVRQAGQCTIVTETRGLRRGQRVIRGMDAAAA